MQADRPRRRVIRGALMLVPLAVLIGCGGSTPSPDTAAGDGGTPPPPPAREDPVAAYVEHALKLARGKSTEEKEKGFYALLHARVFGVKQQEVEAALGPLYAENFSAVTDPEENKRIALMGTSLHMPIQELHGMTGADPKLDAVEVRMLRDEKLVGDARSNEMFQGQLGWLFFLRPAQLSVAQIIEKYGQPQKDHTEPGGTRFLVYGRMVVVQPKEADLPLLLRFKKAA